MREGNHPFVNASQFARGGGRKHATVTVKPDEKGRAIGKGGRNLKVAQMLASWHTEIQSVSVA